MICRCSLSNDSEMREWDDFVKNHPHGTVFHLQSWIKTIRDSYNMEPYLYCIKNDENSISSILPFFAINSQLIGNRIVSLPFTDYCGPLSINTNDEVELLRHAIDNFNGNVKYIEIRSNLTNPDVYQCDNLYKLHVLELCPDTNEIVTHIDKKTIQYSIRKASKAGVEIREENSLWGIMEFYRLNKMTRKKHGVPHQPLRYFENLFRNMFSNGNAFLLLAFCDSHVIAGGMFLRLNKTIYYKYNASDQAWLSEKRPNHLLTWHAIEKACRENYRYFDFGRTDASNDGLIRYKEMWGATSSDLPYYYYPKATGFNCEKSIRGLCLDNAKKIWRIMPDPLIDMISSRIFRHLG